VVLAATHAYVVDGFFGFQVVDISNPTSPAVVGGVGTPDFAQGVAFDGRRVYVTEDEAGLQIFRGQCESPGRPSGWQR